MILKTTALSSAVLALLAVSGSASAVNSNASQRALAVAEGHASAFHINAADKFAARDVIVDANGTENVRFDRTYRGLPVLGGDFVVHSRNGQLKGISQTLKTNGRPGITPDISADQAILTAGARFGTGFNGMPTSHLVVYARGASPVLAHEVVYSGFKADQTPTDMHYIVDAKSGRILDQWDTVETAKAQKGKPGGGGTTTTCSTSATGTGHTLTLGTVAINTTGCSDGSFQMKDLTRGGGYTTDLGNRTSGSGTLFTDADNSWGNGTTSDRASAGADAHYGVAETWDYYKNVHGRNGIANDGKGALSRVHYGRNYVNAFWADSCFCMTFGDGGGSYLPLVALDVAGHEMSHGVTSRTANLTYSGESGGLNEANSDIFGTMVEFYSNNANDTPDYLIGEKIYASNPGDSKALRWMYNPSLDGASPNCYSSNIGSKDVHYSSGVANHFFYLLAEGSGAKTFGSNTVTSPTCNNSSITGIGRDAAQKIWYRALTVYMTSSTNYAGARQATLNAASDLGYSSSAVAAAWSAVGVN
jgi:Zn-dependent metalloprotease